MATDSKVEKGAATSEHWEISPSDAPADNVMGTTQINDREEILLVPAPSSDPRGMYCDATLFVEMMGDLIDGRSTKPATMEEDSGSRYPVFL